MLSCGLVQLTRQYVLPYMDLCQTFSLMVSFLIILHRKSNEIPLRTTTTRTVLARDLETLMSGSLETVADAEDAHYEIVLDGRDGGEVRALERFGDRASLVNRVQLGRWAAAVDLSILTFL